MTGSGCKQHLSKALLSLRRGTIYNVHDNYNSSHTAVKVPRLQALYYGSFTGSEVLTNCDFCKDHMGNDVSALVQLTTPLQALGNLAHKQARCIPLASSQDHSVNEL